MWIILWITRNIQTRNNTILTIIFYYYNIPSMTRITFGNYTSNFYFINYSSRDHPVYNPVYAYPIKTTHT